MLLGIGLFSAITATLTSFMLADRNVAPTGDELRSLAALQRDGLLTDDEYAAKRSDALERL